MSVASRASARARRAWATVNKESGNKSGSGRGVPDTNASSKRGGRVGGRFAANLPHLSSTWLTER